MIQIELTGGGGVIDDLLDAPCAFCGYHGAGYWQAQTHPQECPWHAVGGGDERAAQLRDIVTNAHDELARLRADLAECEARIDQLEAAIRDAPHNGWCSLNEGERTGECDCWKRDALENK